MGTDFVLGRSFMKNRDIGFTKQSDYLELTQANCSLEYQKIKSELINNGNQI